MNERNYSKVPVFENGMAQPVFPFTDGKTGADYDPKTSDIVRYAVYVELYRFREVRWREITKLQHYLKPVRTVQV